MEKIVFIIDDDRLYINNLVDNLSIEMEEMKIKTYYEDIYNIFDDKDFDDCNIFLVDKNIFNGKGTSLIVRNDTIDGFELAKKIKDKNPKSIVYINSSDEDMDNEVDKYNLMQNFEDDKILFFCDKNIDNIIEIVNSI